MTTPFIDVLTTEQQQLVARNSRGDNRPSYYSADIATAQSGANAGNIKISQDLEAVLILLPVSVKQGLLDFIQTALKAISNTKVSLGNQTSLDVNLDFALFEEVLSIRKDNYSQVHVDSGKVVEDYDAARSQVITFIENRARQRMLSNQETGNSVAAADATSVVIPDLSTLFSALTESYDGLARPDHLAVHDRIADAGFVYSVQNAATNRARELSSWAALISVYLATN